MWLRDGVHIPHTGMGMGMGWWVRTVTGTVTVAAIAATAVIVAEIVIVAAVIIDTGLVAIHTSGVVNNSRRWSHALLS